MKKILISLTVLVVILAGIFFALPAILIDADEMGAQLRATLKKATGREVQISQTSTVKLFPVPEVSFEGIQVGNLEGSSSPDFISSSKVTMKLNITSLMAGSVQPSEIILDGASFNFEILPSGLQNWRFTGDSNDFRQYFVDTPVVLNKSAVQYVNAATGARSQLTDVSGILQYDDGGKVVIYNGDVKLHNVTSKVMMRMSSVDMSANPAPDVPFQLVFDHLGSTFTANGRLSSVNRDPEFIGQIKMESGDLWGAASLIAGTQPQNMAPDAEKGGTVTAEGDIRISTRKIIVEDMELLAQGSDTIPALKGTFSTEYGFGIENTLLINADFETIDFDYLSRSYASWSFIDPTLKEQKLQKEEDEIIISQPEERKEDAVAQFMEHLKGSINFKLGSLIYNGRSLNNIVMKAKIAPGRIALQRGEASLPGETKVTFVGEMRKKEEGPTFDGKFQMQGKHLEEFVSLFAPKGVEVPEMELGRFALRTNLSLSPLQYRFSEFQAIVADARMAGSLIFHLGDRLKLESYLRIAHIDIDTLAKTANYLLPEQGGVDIKTTGEQGEQLFEAEYMNSSYNWLTSIGIDVDSDFYLQDFVLWGRKGEEAKFKLTVGVGEVMLSKMNAKYNSAKFTGAYGLRVRNGANPQFVVNGGISELNMVDLFPDLARKRNEKEWQEFLDKPFDLVMLLAYRADIELRVGSLNIRNYSFKNADLKLLLENNQLSVDRFDAQLWGGAVESKFRIMAGTIPSFSMAFRMVDTSLGKLSEATRLLKHAAGSASLRGRLSTSGVSPRSWYNNVQGEVWTQARDVSVSGFGLNQLAFAVPTARTVNNIEEKAKLALESGITRMKTVDGNINVFKGKASTPQLRFTSPEAQGTVFGDVDLINETLDLKMDFFLLNTVEDGEKTPIIRLSMRGDVDDLQKDIDTRELKNYVAQKAAQRELGTKR